VNAMKQAGPGQYPGESADPGAQQGKSQGADRQPSCRSLPNSVTPTRAAFRGRDGQRAYLERGTDPGLQPTVYLDSDVAIKISWKVSSVLKQVATASGTIAPTEIGTRNATHSCASRTG